MDLKIIKTQTAVIEFSKKDLVKFFDEKLDEFGLEGYYIESIQDKTKTVVEPGGDPHDIWETTHFNGLEIHLKKIIQL